MRSAKEAGNFPYRLSTVCYFEVYKDGTVKRIYHKNKSHLPNVIEAYKRAKNDETVMYAVWPGQYSSDMFVIDDLEMFAEKFEIAE